MGSNRLKTVLVAAAAVALAGPSGSARGQSRKRKTLSTGIGVGRIGYGTSVDSFRSFSYGMGGGALRAGPGTDVLRSNIEIRNPLALQRQGLSLRPALGLGLSNSGLGALSIRRTTGLGIGGRGISDRVGMPMTQIPVAPSFSPSMSTGMPSPFAPATRTPSPFAPLELVPLVKPPAEAEGPGIGSALALQDETAFGAARAYLRALEEAATSLLSDRGKPITSLVPNPPGPYRQSMLKGDRAFRANNYHDAYTYFRIANDIGGNDPESLICLTHTQFALSRYSYAKAAFFLELALKRMPELPGAPLRPMGFYGDSDKYAQHMYALDQHVQANRSDGEAQLLLAYFRWFGEVQDSQAARTALSHALAAALKKRDTYLLEAVRTFWDGMVASGKVSGKLAPARQRDVAKEPGGPTAGPASGRETIAPPSPGGAG